MILTSRWPLLLALLLAGCVSAPSPMDCKPTAPRLEWFQTDDGGVFLPRQSWIDLQQYLADQAYCIDQHQL